MNAGPQEVGFEARRRRFEDAFAAAFGPARATHLVRAPGRVNLIGEHTDHCGLPVFPMALQRDVAILFRAREDGRVRLASLDPVHAPREFDLPSGWREPGLARDIEPFAAGDWGNYAKAAAQLLVRRFGIRHGVDGVVHGDVPQAAGLASSSALVVACALALLAANGVDIDAAASGAGGDAGGGAEDGGAAIGRRELMDLLARAERYVGTHSGGMDQAICLGGRSGSAVQIGFHPLRLRPTPVPSGWRFVIANTLVEAKKSGAALQGYNSRERECREALEHVFTYPRSANDLRAYPDLVRSLPPGRLLEIADEIPPPLSRRFRHVVTEALRVEDARSAMLEGDLEAFGRLMDASHASLRDDFEVSCPELDLLVAAAREHGAAGARLTGAGFGGCIVALSRATRVDSLLRGLEASFYSPRGIDAAAADALFVAEPSAGARAIRL